MNAQNKLSLSFTDEEVKNIFVEHLRSIGQESYAEMLRAQCWSCGLYFDERKRCWTLPLKEAPHHQHKSNPVETFEDVNDVIPQDYPVD